MTLRAIQAIRMVSQDGESLARFYSAIGFTVGPAQKIPAEDLSRLDLEGDGLRWTMRIGDQRVEIDQYEQSGAAYPANADSAGPCFQHFAMVTTQIDKDWQRVLDAGAVPISDKGPVRLPASSGGVTAVKFRDPDGHPIELLQFPDPADHGWDGDGTLGIDHSAISTVDLEETLRFFEVHGLSCSGGSHNRGPEQDALDGLTGADAQVRSLAPENTPPHLELLAYARSLQRQPYGGAVNDVASTRIVWESSGEARLLRDPSGHWHELLSGRLKA